MLFRNKAGDTICLSYFYMLVKSINMIAFEFPHPVEIFNETYEEICDFGSSLENLVESSVDDVIWFLRLIGGSVILDHSHGDSKYQEDLFFCEIGNIPIQ